MTNPLLLRRRCSKKPLVGHDGKNGPDQVAKVFLRAPSLFFKLPNPTKRLALGLQFSYRDVVSQRRVLGVGVNEAISLMIQLPPAYCSRATA